MTGQHYVAPGEGESVSLGAVGVVYKLSAEATDGRLSLVEHPIEPRGLAAPRHTHQHEDEYSYVLRGRVGFELAGEVMIGEVGALVLKPRGVPHAFWNASDEPALVLEIISPAGFEQFFPEMARLMETMDLQQLAALCERYGLNMEWESVPELAERHGLVVDPTDARLAE